MRNSWPVPLLQYLTTVSGINLAVKYNLTSKVLQELVSHGKAQYVGVVTCSKTFARKSYPTKNEDFIQSLDATDYAGELRLMPYLVATQRITGFTSEEFAEEFQTVQTWWGSI